MLVQVQACLRHCLNPQNAPAPARRTRRAGGGSFPFPFPADASGSGLRGDASTLRSLISTFRKETSAASISSARRPRVIGLTSPGLAGSMSRTWPPWLTILPFRMCVTAEPRATTSQVFQAFDLVIAREPPLIGEAGAAEVARDAASVGGEEPRGLVQAGLGVDGGVDVEAEQGDEVADVGLLHLELEGARPDLSGPLDMIIEAGVAFEGQPRGELFRAPAVLEAEVVVAVLLLGGDVAHHDRRAVRRVLVEVDRAVVHDRRSIQASTVPLR